MRIGIIHKLFLQNTNVQGGQRAQRQIKIKENHQ